MHSIQPEQLEAFSSDCKARFIDDLTAASSDLHPEIAGEKGRKVMRELVLQYVTEAQSHGLSYDYTISRYTDFRFSLGDPLLSGAEWQWMRDILRHDTIPEEEKIRQIDDLLNFHFFCSRGNR